MKLPQAFLQSLEGITGFDKEAFVTVHEQEPAPTSIRFNPLKLPKEEQSTMSLSFSHQSLQPVPWTSNGYYLSQRPSFTFDPLFHAGCYYVQEASSMFLEQAFRQLLDLTQSLKVLDLCAAPGGKSTHIQSLLSADSLLVSNEVIKNRSLALTDNIMRWGCRNVFVTNNDPKAFQKIPAYFDVMVVDAPCSGSGLFRKDEEAISEWSLHNVQLCSQRQQRILADALPALKEGGLLVYSTCSYSQEEDEAIMDWLATEMEMENVELSTEAFDGIVQAISPDTKSVGYRFYPDKVKGEGFFLSCFRKAKEESAAKLRSAKTETISAGEKNVIEPWIDVQDFHYVRFRHQISAIPRNLLEDFSFLQPVLNMQYAGFNVGEVLKEKLIPHHALALNAAIAENIPATELPYEEAIKYLQRQDLSVQPETTGWQAVRFQKHNLGWINALNHRINNYYPKEIRILKTRNDSAFGK